MRKYKLKEICSYITDGEHGSVKHDEDGKYYLLSAKNLVDGEIVKFQNERIINSEDFRKIRNRTKLERGDVVISTTGTIGNVAVIRDCEDYDFNRDVGIIKCDSNKILAEFLYYYLKEKYVQKRLFNIAKGCTQKHLYITDLEEFAVELPFLEKQKSLVSILEKIDKKIGINNRINDNLEQQAQLIFDYMFKDISGSKHVGDIIVPKRGIPLLTKDAVPGDIPVIGGGLEPSTYHNKANTVAPVITISSSGANAGFVNLWGIPVWSSDSSFIDSTMTPYVYFWYAFLKRHQKNIYNIQTGSAQPHIYPNHIASLPLGDLDYRKIDEYTKRVTPLFLTIEQNCRENKQFTSLRDWLLPMLMNGQAIISD